MINNKLTLDTNQMALQELINFRKLVYKTISQPPHSASDYNEFQLVKEFLLDLILVLIFFKKYEPKNIFFNQENQDDLEKKKQDEYQLDKFISINGLIRGLVYDDHYQLSNNNFILSCSKTFFPIYMSPTIRGSDFKEKSCEPLQELFLIDHLFLKRTMLLGHLA